MSYVVLVWILNPYSFSQISRYDIPTACGVGYRVGDVRQSEKITWPDALLHAQGRPQSQQSYQHDQRSVGQYTKMRFSFVFLGVLDLFLAQPFGGKSLLQR